jgi:hypothetical protein
VGDVVALAAGRLEESLSDALALLRDVAASPAGRREAATEPSPSLLAQCLDMCTAAQARALEPVRVIHHLACTGGTLVAKCIAGLPNVQLLSEVDPLSTILHPGPDHPFVPSDFIQLARFSSRGVGQPLLQQLASEAIRTLHADCVARGLRLVLREHSHGRYCVGEGVLQRPGVAGLVPAHLPTLAVVTVRHPIDSYGALKSHGWVHFRPDTLEEYAARYLAFLQAHPGVPVFRYEDLVQDPVPVTRRMAEALDLAFSEHFQDYLGLIPMSGDSGRKSEWIGERSRRDAARELQESARELPAMRALCNTLGYEL